MTKFPDEPSNGENAAFSRRDFLGTSVTAALALASANSFGVGDSDAALANMAMVDLVKGIREQQIELMAYVEILIARNARYAKFNAFISHDADQLRADARALSARIGNGATAGALGGAVLAVKDNIDVKGYPTTAGTPALEDWRPTADAPVAAAARGAGALIAGKTNMHELALGITSNNAYAGATRNPYNPAMIPGGSSGGTAVAVSAGLASAGLGSDTGGSCRIPAALCGIVGFRPTMHRYSQRGIVPISSTRDTPGPMGRTVADVIALDAVCAERKQPAVAVELKGLRLGVPRQHFYDDLDPGLEAVVEAALERLARAGAVLVEVDLPNTEQFANGAGFAIAMYEQPRDLSAYLYFSGLPFNAEHVNSRVAGKNERLRLMEQLDPDKTLASEAYQLAMEVQRPALKQSYAEYFAVNNLAAMVVPTTPLPARPIGQEDTVELNGKQVPTFPAYIRNSDPNSLTGLPCLSVPAGLTDSGLPVGMEFVGPKDSDASVLAIGGEFEKLQARIAPRL